MNAQAQFDYLFFCRRYREAADVVYAAMRSLSAVEHAVNSLFRGDAGAVRADPAAVARALELDRLPTASAIAEAVAELADAEVALKESWNGLVELDRIGLTPPSKV